ncbi:hypothetical protein M1145_00340 [Patescibacteria group bacterium]|nr:hypothetical protein [Patescibacteria group bacterium]
MFSEFIFFIIAVFVLWVLYVRKHIFFDNDFWDYIVITFILFTIGLLFFSYLGIFIIILTPFIFLKLKNYSYFDIFDFCAIFLNILYIPYFFTKDIYYFLILILVLVFIILLRFIKEGYDIGIFLFVFSILYILEKKLWFLGNNYIYNLDFGVFLLLISLFAILIRLLTKVKNTDYIDILAKKG